MLKEKDDEKVIYFTNDSFRSCYERDFRKEKGGYVKFDPAEAKKLLEEGMKKKGWSTLPEVTLKFTTDTQHKK